MNEPKWMQWMVLVSLFSSLNMWVDQQNPKTQRISLTQSVEHPSLAWVDNNTSHRALPPPSSTSTTFTHFTSFGLWTLSLLTYNINIPVFLFLPMHRGEMLVCCLSAVLSSVLSFCTTVRYLKKKKKKLFFCHLVSLSSLIARAFYKITSKPKNEIPVRVSRMRKHPDQSAEHQNESIIQQHAQSKPHEEETRAHQGWISGLMIPVDQSLCVVPSGLHALILRCQCSISWLIKRVCLTDVFCVWTPSSVNMFVCIFLSDQSFSQPSPASAPIPPKPPHTQSEHHTCVVLVVMFYIPAGRSSSTVHHFQLDALWWRWFGVLSLHFSAFLPRRARNKMASTTRV